ncbi:glutathione S-transferase [Salmonella enterica subsp. enterica serovar Choleraesuis]|nr:glutathione S-transferase [Salmonella enterica subsp. enterica serovar Choleraesuis]
MITLHHLDHSRSHRVIWFLEELQVPWEMVTWQREGSLLAPPGLKQIHPLGKAPIIEDREQVIAESAVILEYLQENYDPLNRFKPHHVGDAQNYRYWMHYAEGSLMPLLMIRLVLGKLGQSPVPWLLRPVGRALSHGIQSKWLSGQLKTHADFLEKHLCAHRWFAGSNFSAADIQMSFPVLALLARNESQQLPALVDWRNRIQEREAYQTAVQKGGPLFMPD